MNSNAPLLQGQIVDLVNLRVDSNNILYTTQGKPFQASLNYNIHINYSSYQTIDTRHCSLIINSKLWSTVVYGSHLNCELVDLL